MIAVVRPRFSGFDYVANRQVGKLSQNLLQKCIEFDAKLFKNAADPIYFLVFVWLYLTAERISSFKPASSIASPSKRSMARH